MKEKSRFIDKPLVNHEIKNTGLYSLGTEIPKRNTDVFTNDYKNKGFDNVDGVWTKVSPRVNLVKLLGESVKSEDRLSNFVDGNTTVADFTGFDGNSNKAPVLVKNYNKRQEKRQKAKITEIGK